MSVTELKWLVVFTLIVIAACVGFFSFKMHLDNQVEIAKINQEKCSKK